MGKLPRRHGRSWASLDSAPSAARQRKGRLCTPRSSLSWASEGISTEVEDEASDESREEGDVWQGDGGEGKASQEGCQVFCSVSAEEEHLIFFFLFSVTASAC